MRRRQFLGTIPLLTAAAGAPAAPPSKVQRWTVITIGNLSRNRYWGESDDKGFRPAICTSTLISGEGFRLLVDPSLADAAAMASEFDRRTGLKLDDVTAVFVTHEHADHTAGLAHFAKVPWYAAAGVAEIINRDSKFPRKLEPAPAALFGAVEVIATPGHTRDHHSLRFDWGGRSIAVAGDAVATQDFWRERRNFYNAVDPATGVKTMEHLAGIATIVVPGHDNYFLST
jgi:glyoxylase-like metal-dependent hydrolase (beta-lactamase superfamily II)